MKTITIMNHYINRDKKGFSAFVNKNICFWTRSDAWHTSIILDDWRHESGHPFGASKTMRIPNHALVKTFSYQVTDEAFEKMVDYTEKKLKENLRYNHKKLISLAFFWPTRWIWNKVKWVAFQNDYHGQVCSVYVREIQLAGGTDWFPKLYKELTPPKVYDDYMNGINKYGDTK